jgi:23S rRNA G2069 N7-methylase RlmK/C1962 C5-methylase RlmI
LILFQKDLKMDLEEVLHKLEEAKELEDWNMIEECIDAIRVLIDDFDEYNNEETWG